MNDDQLDNSNAHSQDLLEAAEFVRAMLSKQPLTETLDHYAALAERLRQRGEYIQRNIGGLL